MLLLTPTRSLPVLLCLGLLSAAFAVVLVYPLIRTRVRGRWATSRTCNSAARLGARFRDAVAAVVTATVRDESNAPLVTVEVLLEDRALHARTRRCASTALARCVATMGIPPANCAVLIARQLERDGRPVRGCVERLACTDGTIRTLISLSIEEDPGGSSSDAIAARLASYYLVATGAERTVLSADPPTPLPRPAGVAATRMKAPESIGRIALPVIVDGRHA
jgi:hypothetical protein